MLDPSRKMGWKKPATRPPASAAFTLIELLVVVAIIALLAALLMPALQQAIQAGRGAICRGNLRQIGQALLMYTQEEDGRLPWYGEPDEFGRPPGAGPYASAGVQWDIQIMPYLGIEWPWGMTSPPAAMGSRPTVFYCPASDPFIPTIATGEESYVRSLSYNYNRYIGRNLNGSRNLALMEDPIQTMLVISAMHSSSEGWTSLFGFNRATGLGRGHTNTSAITDLGFLERGQYIYRHNGLALALFADLHVEGRPMGPSGRPAGIRMYNGHSVYPWP